MKGMTPDAKRQKQLDREKARKQRRLKVAAGAVVIIAALLFTVGSFTTDRPPAQVEDAGTTDGFRRITVQELKALYDRGEVTLIDVRDAGSFLSAHIPGALQIPLARIDGETPYLPKEKTIVTYCTCPAEESSGQAVQILAYRGITNAAALEGGLQAWERRGYPMGAGMPAQK